MKKIILFLAVLSLIACSDEKKEERIRENALASCLVEGKTQQVCLAEHNERIELERLKEENRLLQNRNNALYNQPYQQPIVVQQPHVGSDIITNVASGAIGYVLGSQSAKSNQREIDRGVRVEKNPTYTLPPEVERKFSTTTNNVTNIQPSKPMTITTPKIESKPAFKPIQVMKPLSSSSSSKSSFKPIRVVKPKK